MLDFNLLGGGGLNPLQMATQGYAQGAQLQQAQNLMQQQQQLALQQQQDAEAEQELLSRALGGDVAAKSEFILRKFAKDGKEAQAAFEMMDAPKKQEAKNIATQLYTLSETNPAAARDIIKNRIAAYENTDNLTDEQQQDLAYFKALDATDDEDLPYQTGTMATMALGADEFKKLAGIIAERKKQPLEMRKLEADVKTAETGAAYAEPEAKAKIGKLKAEIKKIGDDYQLAVAEFIKKGQETGNLTPKDKFGMEENLRKQYTNDTKIFQETNDAYKRMQSIGESYAPKMDDKAKGAADIGLIYSYMKMLDPGSVVREGEFATAENTAGIDSKIVILYNKLIDGERLTDSQRKTFMGMGKKLAEAAQDKEKKVRVGLARVAGNYGLDQGNIFMEEGQATVGQSVTTPSAAYKTLKQARPDLTDAQINEIIKGM